ncbi:hypothetical protein R6Z07F_012609 [Ovis aries]
MLSAQGPRSAVKALVGRPVWIPSEVESVLAAPVRSPGIRDPARASRNLGIAQNFFFPALSSFYLCASAIEGARGPRSVVSTTVGVSVWNPGHRWSEVETSLYRFLEKA